MKKKLLVLLVLGCLVFGIGVSAEEVVTVYVNGTKVVSDVPAVLVNNSTMLPLRAVCNALGVKNSEIQWNNSSKSIEIRSGGKYIFLAIGSQGAIVEDDMVTLDTSPYLQTGTAMVPVRFVSETLGAQVDWNGNTKTVTITK